MLGIIMVITISRGFTFVYLLRGNPSGIEMANAKNPRGIAKLASAIVKL